MNSIREIAQWAKAHPSDTLRMDGRTFEDASVHLDEKDALHILEQLSGRKWTYNLEWDVWESPSPSPRKVFRAELPKGDYVTPLKSGTIWNNPEPWWTGVECEYFRRR